MIKDFPNFIPNKVCLACEGCCRFSDVTSAWRPKVTREDRMQMAEDDQIDARGYVTAKEVQGQCPCVFLNEGDNICGVYSKRPLECQLYPFLLLQNQEEVSVGVHLSCPYAREMYDTDVFQDDVARLKEYFLSNDAKEEIGKYSGLAGTYSGYENEIKELFIISL